MSRLIQVFVVLAVICQSFGFFLSSTANIKASMRGISMSDAMKSPLPTFEEIISPPKPPSSTSSSVVVEDSPVADRTSLDSALDFLEEETGLSAQEEQDREFDMFEIYEDSPDIEIPYELIAKLEQDEINAQINKKPSQAIENQLMIKEAIKPWQHHENDFGSTEVQIAALNERVRYLTRHLLANKNDFAAKRGLNDIVNQRRKLLNYLYENNRDRAEEMLNTLGIRFKPPGRLWDKESKYGAFKNTKSPNAKMIKKSVASTTMNM